MSFTVIEMVVELLSAELFAQTVNIAVEVTRGWCSVDGSVGCAKQETAR